MDDKGANKEDRMSAAQQPDGIKNVTTTAVFQDLASSSLPRVRMSGTEIRFKEVVLVCLALALLVFSIALFFKHWSKNYREINTVPYYAYLYKVIQSSPYTIDRDTCVYPRNTASDITSSCSSRRESHHIENMKGTPCMNN